VVEGIALEKQGQDGIKVVKGPMWKCGPGPPATLRRTGLNIQWRAEVLVCPGLDKSIKNLS